MDEHDITNAEERIQNAIEAAALRIRQQIQPTEVVTHCIECGDEIPEARRKAAPFAKRCISCQQGAEH